MAKPADTGCKWLIGKDPDRWLKWTTKNPNVTARRVLAPTEFQWITRETDALILAHAPDIGNFLCLNEVQLYYRGNEPRRINAYASLAEEKYDLPVYAILTNILPPKLPVVNYYESVCMGLAV